MDLSPRASPSPPARGAENILRQGKRIEGFLRGWTPLRSHRHLYGYAPESIELGTEFFQLLIRQLELFSKDFTAFLEREHGLFPGTGPQCLRCPLLTLSA